VSFDDVLRVFIWVICPWIFIFLFSWFWLISEMFVSFGSRVFESISRRRIPIRVIVNDIFIMGNFMNF